ncbi:NUDIX domain-containing protein [Pseudoxanthomonas wuyuanensis]|uniref:8-oxo-dGTP diphosphatase n=1 Tax=Pseudoxanthomonas wuyuanensis TaxID=1073196 RepID=A0A286D6Q1_9GAMM|nr:NUDIX domain-containing protein [Pseudoxanthomonas wuyuanensis]KAF1718739.1 NUDIX domain-containing protein [Pseudoxanthomonas wuyuanensis]SOD54339.1 mutator mutT protein [Pseudoxanthomonas wuyuanensis]
MNAPRHDCVGALLVRGGRVLLGKRSQDVWLAGAWDVFGGHVETGESAEAALRRELEEELGITPRGFSLLATLDGDQPEPWRLRLYLVTAWDGEPRNLQPREHVAIGWCSLEQAQAHLAAAHPQFPALLARAMGA